MINHTDENNNPEVQCKFGNAIKKLGICRLLKESNIRKKKGGSVYEIFQFLLLLVFQNCNLFHFLNSKKQDMTFSKIVEGLRTEAIKITNAVKTQLINWFVSQPAFIKALFPESVWEV